MSEAKDKICEFIDEQEVNNDELIDILFEYCDASDILSRFDDDELLDQIKDTWSLDSYVEDEVEKQLGKLKEEYETVIREIENEKLPSYKELTPDETYEMLCKFAGVATNDYSIEDNVEEIFDKIQRSSYVQLMAKKCSLKHIRNKRKSYEQDYTKIS